MRIGLSVQFCIAFPGPFQEGRPFQRRPIASGARALFETVFLDR